MAKKPNLKFVKPDNDARQAEAAKTTRLRGLRLAKEAADKAVAELEAAAKASKIEPRRRVRAPPAPAAGPMPGAGEA